MTQWQLVNYANINIIIHLDTNDYHRPNYTPFQPTVHRPNSTTEQPPTNYNNFPISNMNTNLTRQQSVPTFSSNFNTLQGAGPRMLNDNPFGNSNQNNFVNTNNITNVFLQPTNQQEEQYGGLLQEHQPGENKRKILKVVNRNQN
jgi:hypothetical protein